MQGSKSGCGPQKLQVDGNGSVLCTVALFGHYPLQSFPVMFHLLNRGIDFFLGFLQAFA